MSTWRVEMAVGNGSTFRVAPAHDAVAVLTAQARF